jgi:stage II sporulation protein D
MNNSSDENSTQAVKDTQGIVLTYNDEVVESFYYSTSGGYNGALAVWSSTYGQSLSTSSYLIETGEELFATNSPQGEAAYRAYIDEGNVDDVEYEEAWYRWSFDRVIGGNDLSELFKSIYSLSQSQPENVEIISDNNNMTKNLIYESKISDIQILNRQKSGLVTKLLITTPNYKITLATQYTIRQVLGSLGGSVIRKDGSQYTLNGMLPSAYFYIDNTAKDGAVTLISIHGAGFGHGCGMSQNGAKNLANEGLDYEQILKYYYNADVNYLSLRSSNPSTP